MWDTPWQPIRESAALLRYWRGLARERCSGMFSKR